MGIQFKMCFFYSVFEIFQVEISSGQLNESF